MKNMEDFITIVEGSPRVKSRAAFLGALDSIVYEAVFEKNEKKKRVSLEAIKEVAKAEGAIPSSIRSLYEEMGRNYSPFLPKTFREEVYEFIKSEFSREKKEGQTEE